MIPIPTTRRLTRPQVIRRAAVWLLLGVLALPACADDSYVIGATEDTAGGTDSSGTPANNALVTLGKDHLAQAACSRGPPTCPGATWPDFSAENFQPASSLNGKAHGLEAFKGKIIIVAMLAAW